MTINYGDTVKIIIKRTKKIDGKIVYNGPFPAVEEIVVFGEVSGPFQDDWLSVYDKENSGQLHAIIDLRNNK